MTNTLPLTAQYQTPLSNIALERPLLIFDLETTGTNPQEDRIVEISLLKLLPDGQAESRTLRVNPGIPIPSEATAIHRISDADVMDESYFGEHADEILAFLDGCDLCGFNIKQFDLPLLQTELCRAGLTLSLAGRAIVDILDIFRHYERRDLPAAVKFYCGREHVQSHEAIADVLATAEVLDAMVARYADLPRDISQLHQRLSDPNAVDVGGRFIHDQGRICFAFGKYKGEPLDSVVQRNRGYLIWLLKETFLLDDAKGLICKALEQSKGRRAG